MAVWSKTSLHEITETKRIDGEYYHPEYLSYEKIVRESPVKFLGELGDFLIGPFGSAFHVSNYDNSSEYRYIRGKDVKPFQLLDDDSVYMPYSDFKRLEKYSVQTDDLMISVVGTLGNVAIVPDEVKGIFSCKSTVFRNSKINPYYLLAYFNSKYGKKVLLRRQRGAVQTGLNKEDLKTVPIPIYDELHIDSIGNLVKNSLNLQKQSQTLYKEAEELLEKELGLDGLEFEKPRSYTAKLSEVYSHNRCDADFYQTKYKQIDYVTNHIKKIPIKNISERLETGQYSSKYSENGTRYYIRGTDIDNTNQVNMEKLLKTSKLIPKNNNTVICNDLLVTRVGSIGVVGIVDELLDGSFFSDNLIRIRIKKDLLKEILPNYLNLLLSSSYGQNQMIRFSRGSVQQRLNQTQLGEIPIPIIDLQKQILIENLIIDSKQALKQSKQLLEDAKAKVEALIEEASR